MNSAQKRALFIYLDIFMPGSKPSNNTNVILWNVKMVGKNFNQGLICLAFQGGFSYKYDKRSVGLM